MIDGLESYQAPAGWSLPVPIGWEVAAAPRPDTALVAVEPDRGGGFRANVVVTADELLDGLDLISWQMTVEPLFARVLADYLLLDVEDDLRDESGAPVLRRLAHHVVEGHTAVTMEQWARVHAGRGWTVTCSVATSSYDSLADVFAEVAQRWRPAPAGEEPT